MRTFVVFLSRFSLSKLRKRPRYHFFALWEIFEFVIYWNYNSHFSSRWFILLGICFKIQKPGTILCVHYELIHVISWCFFVSSAAFFLGKLASICRRFGETCKPCAFHLYLWQTKMQFVLLCIVLVRHKNKFTIFMHRQFTEFTVETNEKKAVLWNFYFFSLFLFQVSVTIYLLKQKQESCLACIYSHEQIFWY